MRNTVKLGIGMGTAAIVATMSAGVAMATTSGQSNGSVAAVSMVNRHITRAQARTIARAKVPHSRVIEVESDDAHDRAVWKVQLATPHGRVVVDVDKRTGKATIVRHGGGRDLAVTATVFAGQRSGAGDDRSASAAADDHARDARDQDGARDARGERHGHHRGDRHDRERGRGADDGAGR